MLFSGRLSVLDSERRTGTEITSSRANPPTKREVNSLGSDSSPRRGSKIVPERTVSHDVTCPADKRPLYPSGQYAPDGNDRNPDQERVEEVVERRSPTRPFLGSTHGEADRDERRWVRKDDPEKGS